MNEIVKAQYEAKVNALAPHLAQNTDHELAARADTLFAGMRELAEQSADAMAFEEVLCSSPLNIEYGAVYGELLAQGGGPSAKDVFDASMKGIREHKKTLARTAVESAVDTAALHARVEIKDAFIDATHDDYMKTRDAIRDIPGVGELEQAAGVFSMLKGVFGKKK